MSALPRVQLSLTFDNIDFFHSYVKPVKDNREITPLIMRLLEAYFLDTGVQQAVDAFGLEDVGMEDVAQGEFSDALAKAKETLAMMSILSESAQDTLSDGMMNISDMVSQVDEVHSAMEDMPEQTAPAELPRLALETPTGDSIRLLEMESAVKNLTSEMSELKTMFKQLMMSRVEVPTSTVGEPTTESSVEEISVEASTEELDLFDESTDIEEPVEEVTLEVEEGQGVAVVEEQSVESLEEPTVETVSQRRSAVDILADIDATLGVTTSMGKPAIKAPIDEDFIEEESEIAIEGVSPAVSVESNEPIDGASSLMSFLSDFE